MRFTTIILILITFANHSVAQSSFSDSIKNQLESSNQSRHAELYNLLSKHYNGIDYEQGVVYARKAMNAAKKNNQKGQLADAYVNLAAIYHHKGLTDKGLILADSGAILAKEANNSVVYFWAKIQLGNLLRRKSDYNNAMRHIMVAIKIGEQLNDDILQAKAYNSLAVIYATMHDLDMAEEYYRKAIEKYNTTEDYTSLSRTVNNIGILHRERGQYDSAMAYYLQSLELAKKANQPTDIAFLYNDIGAAYSFMGETNKAEQYLQKSISMRLEMNELNEIAYTYNYLGENYERKHNLEKAEEYIKKALATAIQISNNKQHYEALESLSEFYSRNNMYDSAYTYLKKHKALRDSLRYMDNKQYIAELQTQYETEKKEQEIALQKSEISKRDYIIAGVSVLLFLVAILSYTLYNRYKLKQQDRLQKEIIRQQELATEAVIIAEERERKRIAADLHDGVGQTMSAAKMNLSSISRDIPFVDDTQRNAFDKAMALVDEGCKEVRTVSHNIMPNALLKTGLATAIRDFLNKIDSKVLTVNLYTDGLNNRLDSDTETVLYRVVQECVNNVIKHAHANTLYMSLIKDEDGISITIEDNGKGFDLNTAKKQNGIGLQNLTTRIQYLKGTIEWDSSPGKGTVVTINIPTA